MSQGYRLPPGPDRCDRCGGSLFPDEDELACLQCGARAPVPEELESAPVPRGLSIPIPGNGHRIYEEL